jgi:lipopolysaccharide transport system ATP-binding protein
MSSDDIAISVRNLTKTYRIFGHPGDRIKQAATFGIKRYYKEFTALRDVSFDIKKGETVGIIGRNGSGKSTLLQLICGILKPTSGSVHVNGRVSALLELGAGFNPEFTGRENVYFQGALMGFTKSEMDSRFDDIAAFADIGEFIDQPVRTYSSGMFVRLAFAVAVNVEPDILLIDEALAVGDTSFQKKCMTYFRRFRDSGRSMLFVSHDINLINSICTIGIELEPERGCRCGFASEVSAAYLRSLYADAQHKMEHWQSASFPSGKTDNSAIHIDTTEAIITKVELLDDSEEFLLIAGFCQSATVRLHISFFASCEILAAYYISDNDNILLGSSTSLEGLNLVQGQAGDAIVIDFCTTLPLAEGSYRLSAQLSIPIVPNSSSKIISYVGSAATFTVEQRSPIRIWSKAYTKNHVLIRKLHYVPSS